MQLSRATCPSCSGELQIPTDRPVVHCMYCGSQIVVREVLSAAAVPAVANLMTLAAASQNAGNFAEAYTLYGRVLEADSGCVEAWYSRAICAGSLSTLAAPRLGEMASGIADALSRCSPEEWKPMSARAVSDLLALSVSFLTAADNHYREFQQLESAFGDYIGHTADPVEALEFALRLDPNNVAVISSLANIYRQLLTPRVFEDRIYNLRIPLHYPEPYASELRREEALLRDRLAKLPRFY